MFSWKYFFRNFVSLSLNRHVLQSQQSKQLIARRDSLLTCLKHFHHSFCYQKQFRRHFPYMNMQHIFSRHLKNSCFELWFMAYFYLDRTVRWPWDPCYMVLFHSHKIRWHKFWLSGCLQLYRLDQRKIQILPQPFLSCNLYWNEHTAFRVHTNRFPWCQCNRADLAGILVHSHLIMSLFFLSKFLRLKLLPRIGQVNHTLRIGSSYSVSLWIVCDRAHMTHCFCRSCFEVAVRSKAEL